MSSNVCGNCANFKPAKGAKFFDCTLAQQGGVKYAMQVRPDTRSCEAFASLKPSPKPQAAVKPAAPTPKRAEPQRGVLCNWGRAILVAALIIVILLIAFGAYTCFKGGGTPAETPTPQPTQPPPPVPTPTLINTPTPAPTSTPINYYNLGDWASSPPWMIIASSANKQTQYSAPGPVDAPPSTVFVFVRVTVTNAGSSSLSIAASDFTLRDKFGGQYQAQQLPIAFYQAFPWFRTTLSPGKTVGGNLLFTVPNISSELHIVTLKNSQYLAWSLGF